mgnify:FL=1
MNRILKLVALVLLPCLALSCCKKNNEEPKPEIKTGKFSQILPDENGQRAAVAPIAFSLPEGKEFKLQVEGVGDLTLVGAYATQVKGIYKAGKSGKVGIEGSLNIFDLTSDDVTEVKVQKSSPALKRLVVLTEGYGNSNLKNISLDNAPNLTYLWLGGHELSTLDLTKLEKLVLLGLGSWGGKSNNPYFPGKERSSDYKKVLLPANNVIEYISTRSPLTNESIDLDNLPKLKVLMAQSPWFSKVSLAKSQDVQLVAIIRPSGGKSFEINLKDKPQLEDITLIETKHLLFKVHNTPKLSAQKSNLRVLNAETVDLAGIPAQAFTSILSSFSGAKVANLSVAGKDIESLDLAKFTSLKKLTLKTTGINEDALVSIVNALPSTNGVLILEASRATAKVKAALQSKGWTTAEN